MNTFINVAPLVAGGYMILGALMLHTKNAKSSLVFKVIPFTLGACSVFAGLKLIGAI